MKNFVKELIAMKKPHIFFTGLILTALIMLSACSADSNAVKDNMNAENSALENSTAEDSSANSSSPNDSSSEKAPSSALTADDFYFYDALGKKYMPGTLTDKNYGLVLSSIEKVLKQKYYTFRKLAINDDASKISELYNEVDWDYDIYIPDEIYNGTAAETAEYLNKLLEIKSKPEFVNLHNAGEFIENESSIIGDENFQIFLQFKMVSIDNKLYAYNVPGSGRITSPK
jgi:flagellar biosynthesis/type III secretory pathway chaperone